VISATRESPRRRASKALLGLIALLSVVAAALASPSARSSSTTNGAPARIFAAFGEPLPGVDAAARASFARGRAVAARQLTPSEGLGPAYNAVACGNCHEKPVLGGGASRYRASFLAARSKETFVTRFEHHFTVSPGAAPARVGPTATRVPPPFFGVGLLAEIPAEEIVKRADPRDRDGDGISGRVNFERGFVGRFGRKAQMASIQGFVRLALLDQMGVTSTPVKTSFIAEKEVPVELPTRDADGVADPELSTGDLSDLLAFVALLAPPSPDEPTPETRLGEATFVRLGCGSCHVPALRGPRGDVPAYTDLLLHDMGPALADDVTVGEAGPSEFRTQPLWGIAAAGPYLHDGRADTLDEAILAHGGEGEASRRRYEAIPAAERTALVAFLRSLGGRDRRADGLLAIDAPIPPLGALGAPRTPLDGPEAARFARGRALFDHDYAKSEGLGPRFNGDACRSCHFAPIVGGAGPSDVDVVRHGTIGLDGRFHVPASNDTMAHRFVLLEVKPSVDPNANVFERRQTPAIFGLGLVDLVPDDVIRAGADPDDRDHDGVRGVVSALPDGRVGRFGWKAQIATLAEFAADAFKNELGIEEPARDVLDDVVFFMANLAPPVSPAHTGGDPGSAAFAEVGCATCHTPELRTRDGSPVRLYSDLLLHDVAPPEVRLVEQPPTRQGRAFRTPPLWGIAQSAPYLHDGAAESLDAAIRRHDGEARRSRNRYLAASDADRAALLTFLHEL
jgi:CxxC motif-containing protein (DUF1111 family)